MGAYGEDVPHPPRLTPLPDEMAAAPPECDWGNCDAVASRLRFDRWGHGWLPVCDRCARMPEEL